MAAKKETAKVMDNTNVMRTPKISKVVLNVGGVGDKVDKGMILLQKLTGKKPVRVATTKRIPTWNVRPGLVVGVKVTLRGEDAENFIKKVLPAINSTIKERQIRPNFVSFGVHEYIEIPGMEYIREVGIMGFEVTVVFLRAGKKVELRKVKRGKMRRQDVTVEEIEKILQDKFKIKILRKRKQEKTE
ncbi:50S ribosomal protein L5 [uncultured archaeon]|nr:50S ribosomal protein L5 [uncultured archaeon]